MRISDSEETLSQAPNLCPRNNYITVVHQFCPVFVIKHCGEDSVDGAVRVKKKKKKQLYPLLKE